jgi:hypothetical protein
MAFGQLRQGFQAVAGARPFEYEISGDFQGRGRALVAGFHQYTIDRSADAG